ncbi:transcription termination factor Rho [Gordonia sp. NB41Y]|uniref:transcription termination factor Rho n=1 Tax=Gordonia sp. NB41Y TaxID=875808 RepID=UPI0006B1D438|nr:transcription termination factor Rho [Gordonia sp. NB41Y]KOY49233.1 transcription termination factor Rho [Gordonia sp. NB41Y]WLP91430.1 transcription termination factor Rho [Gordonia sp. NB41Y]
MTDTDLITAPASPDNDSAGTGAPKTRTRAARTGLSGMVLSELRALAGELGIKGTSGMRKGDLIAAIKERQAAASPKAAAPEQMTLADEVPAPRTRRTTKKADAAKAETAEPEGAAATKTEAPKAQAAKSDAPKADADKADGPKAGADKAESAGDDAKSADAKSDDAGRGRNNRGEARNADDDESGEGGNRNRNNRNRNRENNQNREGGQGRDSRDNRDNRSGQGNQGGNGPAGNRNNANNDEDDEQGGRRRGRRFRERRRGREREGGTPTEPQVSDDDVLQPVAGILDVLDNYAFVRTSGYLAGPNDVYVSMNLVRKNGLRRGDAITGAVKVPREGEQPNQRQKFNPLVRLDTVNGGDVEAARKRAEFNKLTPLYPNQRLRLETTPDRLSTRVIDLIMPIGKGQRALIVSPPKAGKTTILQDIANAITTNNPECHLMVVLVDERPEEVTDMQRSVKGEVIASTFDRPPSDHTSVAELAIERAKRLVEGGKDVVVLLDSITRLGRAYNNASPASGRILSGGVDSTALYPPKRFLGAARNIENGGSLTIIASALVETGSTGDTVIFEEFKGTGNAELKLDRKISERRVFPAVDVNLSSTRKDELLLAPEEFAIVHKLRRVLSGLDSQQAIDLLVSQLKKTRNNIEFLMQVQTNAPGAMKDD